MKNQAILYLVLGAGAGYMAGVMQKNAEIERMRRRIQQAQQQSSGGLDLESLMGIVSTAKGLF